MDFKLKYVIDADGKKVKSELKSIDDHIARLGGGITKTTGLSVSQMNALALGAGAAAAGVAAIGAAALATGRQLFELTKQAAEYGSTIFDASEKTGLTAETLSAMDFAAKQSGTSLEQLTTGIGRYAKSVGAAADGSKEAAANLKALGIDPQEALQDLDGSLAKVFKRIQDAKPGIEQMTLAQKAFGKAGADLLPFIKSFDGDLAGLIRRAKQLGVTIDDDAARAADEFGDQLDTLNAQFDALGRTIGIAFMPIFMDMARATSNWATQNKDEVKRWADAFAIATRGILGDLGRIVQFARDNELWLRIAMAVGTQGASEIFRGIGRTAGERYAQQNRDRGQTGLLGGGISPLIGGGGGGDFGLGTQGGRTSGRGRTRSGDARSDKQAYEDFIKALRTFGVIVGKGQGFRSYADQAGLYARLPKGEAARPGTSEHEFYRGIDTAVGVSQEILQRAAAIAGVTIEKSFIHQGTGRHRHTAFRKGGGGEAELIELQDEQHKKGLAGWAKRIELIKQGFDVLKEEVDLDIAKTIKEQTEEFEAQVAVAGSLLDLEMKRLRTIEDEKATLKEMMDESFKGLVNPNMQPRERKSFGGTFLEGIGATAEADSVFDPNGIARIKTQAEALEETFSHLGGMGEQAFGQMAAGFGSMVEQWVLFGDAGPDALRKMTASVLANLAAQAAVEAIMETARGFAALARYDFASAANHFTSAAIFGGVAAGAALAGRAIAGDTFSKDQGGRGASGGTTSSSGSSSNQNLTPISRRTDDAFISGRRVESPQVAALTSMIETLDRKITSMKPGDVLVAGANQKQGFIGRQAATDISNNAGLGTRIKRVTGAL